MNKLIKNIEIYDNNGKIFRDWKLAKHSKNKVYDRVAYARAAVYNPI